MDANSQMGPQLWDCDPLVIVDSDDVVAFAGRCKVEFTPAGTGEERGSLVALGVDVDGWAPSMVAEGRMPAQPEDIVPFPISAAYGHGIRVGRTYWGSDQEGNEFTWYINGDADRYLMDRGWQTPRSGGSESGSAM